MSVEMGANIKNKAFYQGRNVFVTGHTGYKGAWLTAILHELGSNMTGYALKAPEGSLFDTLGGNHLNNRVVGYLRDF